MRAISTVPLNDPRFKGASILLSCVNFGCGSSREHAPQALSKFGFKAVIAELLENKAAVHQRMTALGWV